MLLFINLKEGNYGKFEEYILITGKTIELYEIDIMNII